MEPSTTTDTEPEQVASSGKKPLRVVADTISLYAPLQLLLCRECKLAIKPGARAVARGVPLP